MLASCRPYMLKLSIRSLCLQFFTIVALPQYQAFCSVFPGCQPLLAAVKDNYKMRVVALYPGSSPQVHVSRANLNVCPVQVA